MVDYSKTAWSGPLADEKEMKHLLNLVHVLYLAVEVVDTSLTKMPSTKRRYSTNEFS